jgi:hypothetical protein
MSKRLRKDGWSTNKRGEVRKGDRIMYDGKRATIMGLDFPDGYLSLRFEDDGRCEGIPYRIFDPKMRAADREADR